MATEQEIVELDFGGDLSANRQTQWVPMKNPVTGVVRRHFSIGISWPATVVGTLSIRVATTPFGVGTGTPYVTPIPSADQPSGTAAAKVMDGGETDSGWIGVTYTRTSGGTGLYFSDESAKVGAKPRLVLTD